MAKNFGAEERKVKSILSPGTVFTYNGKAYTVIESGKPTCYKGEPKTDIYVLASFDGGTKEFKISYKKENADFLENKTSADRAEALFGSRWAEIITEATSAIKEAFYNKPLIYKKKYGRTDKGAFTLGWKFELLNKDNGELSNKMNLSRQQVIDVYAGTNLPTDKRDALVNGKEIKNSGIATHLLFRDDISTADDIFDNLYSIVEFIDIHPDVYFACKALNYRCYSNKWDGNRPLAVYVDWSVSNGKLSYEIKFDKPLTTKGDEVGTKLLECLGQLRIETDDDINENNVEDHRIVFE